MPKRRQKPHNHGKTCTECPLPIKTLVITTAVIIFISMCLALIFPYVMPREVTTSLKSHDSSCLESYPYRFRYALHPQDTYKALNDQFEFKQQFYEDWYVGLPRNLFPDHDAQELLDTGFVFQLFSGVHEHYCKYDGLSELVQNVTRMQTHYNALVSTHHEAKDIMWQHFGAELAFHSRYVMSIIIFMIVSGSIIIRITIILLLFAIVQLLSLSWLLSFRLGPGVSLQVWCMYYALW